MNKDRNRSNITLLSILLGCIILLGIIIYNSSTIFKDNDIWDINSNDFSIQMNKLSGNEGTINIKEITQFEWDTMYSFYPYISKEEIYEIVGYKWGEISETVSEGMNQIVFMNNNDVVCYLYGYPDSVGYWFNFDSYDREYKKFTYDKDVLFEVSRNDNIVYLDYIGN